MNDLIAHGTRVEMDCSNEKMRLMFSDKNLIKFKCDLIEEDYPKEFPETDSTLDLNLKKPIKSMDLPLGHFTRNNPKISFLAFSSMKFYDL